ncbi:hypothetical protein [Streptomyces sp. NPDC056188]|uniref:hypothetical protein n=1 Tax=Streptomyces sp. NPDC056188 TaxID=3345740 RepID=UPI0035DAEDAE
MPVRAAWLLPGGTVPGQTREDTRIAPVGTWAPAGELTTRPGVVPGGEPFRATGAGAMDLQIGTGRAVAQGTTAQGAYPVAVDAPETVRFEEGDAQHPRVDTVVVRVYDGLYDASGDTLARVEIVRGEPAPSPVAAVLLGACVPLWDVRVPAGTSAGVGGIPWSSALTDRRAYAVAVGGIRPGGSAATPGAYDGQYRDNGSGLERWNAAGAVWEKYPREADTGWRTLTLASGFVQPAHGSRPAWRRIGASQVYLRGRISRSNGQTIASSDTLLTLPAEIRPNGGAAVWGAAVDRSGGSAATIRIEIGTTGALKTFEGTTPPTWISLDNCAYFTD